MKTERFFKTEYYYLETDEAEYNCYRRDVKGNKNSWEVAMGESWETTYDRDDLEELLKLELSVGGDTDSGELSPISQETKERLLRNFYLKLSEWAITEDVYRNNSDMNVAILKFLNCD